MYIVRFVIACITCILFLASSLAAYASLVTINEVVVHPSSGNKEWVEFYNPDKIDLTNYFIDDDTDFVNDIGSPKKKLTAMQGIDTIFPYIELSSAMFNNSGDTVVLFDEAGNIVDQYSYTKDPGTDVSFGRNPDGAGDFAILSRSTKGQQNAAVESTPTLSPTKVPTPTHTPVPTHTPIPTHTPTPFKSTKYMSPTEDTSVSYKAVDEITPSLDIVISLSASASSEEAVLAASTSATPRPTRAVKTLIKAASHNTNMVVLILAGVGGVCLMVCAILISVKRKA